MGGWWNDLQPRERAVLAAGAAGLLVLLLLLGRPLLAERERLRQEIATRQGELAWMRDAAEEISQSGGTPRNDGDRAIPVLQFIDQAARENRLSDRLKRLEPGPDGEIKVWLNNVVYVDLVRWLRQLDATGRLTIRNLNVEKGGAPGQVNAQLTLDSGGAP